MTTGNNNTFFAPQLFIDNGVKDISFYAKAIRATERFCLRNDDDRIHIAELSINGAIFQLHETTAISYFLLRGNTTE